MNSKMLFTIKEKYIGIIGLILFGFLSLLWIFCMIIGIVEITLGHNIENSTILGVCFSFGFIYYLKYNLVIILDSAKYTNFFGSVKNTFLIILYVLFMGIIIIGLKGLNANYRSQLVRYSYLFLYLYLFSLPLKVHSYKNFSMKTYKWFRSIIIFSIIIQVVLLVVIYITYFHSFWMDYRIDVKIVFNVIFLNFISNIIVLIILLFKRNGIKKWKETRIGKQRYMFNINKEGEISDIYIISIGNTYRYIPKYSNYIKIMDFNISNKWIAIKNQLIENPDINEEEMIVNNEFLGNIVFSIYYQTLKWNRLYVSIVRMILVNFGIIGSLRAVEILYKMKNPVDSHMLLGISIFSILLGIEMLWVDIFKNDKIGYKKIRVGFIILLLMFMLGNMVIYFDMYKKVIAIDILVFIYLLFSGLDVSKKIKKDYRYTYFKA